MPRVARHTVPGVVYHVISNFVDGTWFFQDDRERRHYLQLLGRAIASSDWTCISYAVMSNHIHLGMVSGRQQLWRVLKRVNSPFARWLNKRRGRSGPVFAERAWMTAMPADAAARLVAYIHNNPVRANVVAHASQSAWTSHRSYVGLSDAEPWLDVAEGMRQAHLATPADVDAYVTEFARECRDPVALENIRRVFRPRGRVIPGTPIDGERLVTPVLARPFATLRPSLQRVVELAAAATGVPLARVCSRTPGAGPVRARRITTHVARSFGFTGSDIAAVLTVSDQTVSRLGLEPLVPDDARVARRIAEYLVDEASSRETVNRP